MFEPHEGDVRLQNSFGLAHRWLEQAGDVALSTAKGTPFIARATMATRGAHAGEAVIRFIQGGQEYARAYRCCWEHYYNCHGTRIGMYCQALDASVSRSHSGLPTGS